MTSAYRKLGLVLVLLALAGSAAAAAKVLNGKQLRQLLFGNTLIGQTEWADAEWHAYVDLDGRIHIKGSRPTGAYEFFGQVTIEHGLWCEKWQIKNHDQKQCRQIARDGNRFSVMRDDGHVISTFAVRSGDLNGYGGPSLVAAVPAPPPPSADGADDTPPDQPVPTPADQPAAADQSSPPADAGTAAAAPTDQPAANAQTAPASDLSQPATASPPTEIATTPPTAPAQEAPTGSAPISLGLPQHDSAIALTNDSVIGWHRQGVDDATIVTLIKQSKTAFDLSPKALEVLDKAGITKTVIGAMLAADLKQ